MALADDLKSEVATIFSGHWELTQGRLVPVPSSVGLGNKAIELASATVLYADLSGSTAMVDNHTWQFSAEIYKVYLHCAAKIVKAQGGVITAYDGDRIMAVYIGDYKNTEAVRTALKLNQVVDNIINPAIRAQYPSNPPFVMRHTVGIDTSPLRVARTGVRGDNDLVWIGRAANYAAKLTSTSTDTGAWITSDVYNEIADEVKHYQGKPVWEAHTWSAMNNTTIYRSGWRFVI